MSRSLVQDRRRKKRFACHKDAQKHHSADHIKTQMHKGRPLCIFARPCGGGQRRNAGSYILPHNNGNRRCIGDLPRSRQRLQNTNRGRAGLDHRRQKGSGKQTQKRIFEQKEHLLEGGQICEPGDSRGHGLHSKHQCGKSQKNHSGILPFG